MGKLFTYLPMKMEQTECSETSAYTIQTPGNYPEENIQHTELGESLKSRRILMMTGEGVMILKDAVVAYFKPLNAEINPMCHLLALLGAHPILHVSRIRVKMYLWSYERRAKQQQGCLVLRPRFQHVPHRKHVNCHL